MSDVGGDVRASGGDNDAPASDVAAPREKSQPPVDSAPEKVDGDQTTDVATAVRRMRGEQENVNEVMQLKDLEEIEEVFGQMNNVMSRDDFIDELLLLLQGASRAALADLFDKIDVAKKGEITWEQFTSQLMIEFSEVADKAKASQIPQWKELISMPNPHRDSINKVHYIAINAKYVCMSKEGVVSFWGNDLKQPKSFRLGTDACKSKDIWVTDFVYLPSLKQIIVAFTSKELWIFDISTKLEFTVAFRVVLLPHMPLKLDFHHDFTDPSEALLFFGDSDGVVHVIKFLAANIALFERTSEATSQDKGVRIEYKNLWNTTANRYIRMNKYRAHHDWIKTLRYVSSFDCVITVTTTNEECMSIGWLDKFRSAEIRTTKFNTMMGFNHFDFNDTLNIICTAGCNNAVCFWNPYVVSKPSGVLNGHMAPVVQVQFIRSRGQLMSFGKDKVMRLWDVGLQMCIHRVAGIFPKLNDPAIFMMFHEDANRLFLSFNSSLFMLEMKKEHKDRIVTHDKPVVGFVFHPVYKQIGTVSLDGNLTIWLLDSGQRVKSFSKLHGQAEVISVRQAPDSFRIFTGGTDGMIKMWDYSGHCFHCFKCDASNQVEVSDVLPLKRSILAHGYSKFITVFRDTSMKQFNVEPSEWKGGQEHLDDILASANWLLNPNIIATGSYDGEIIIWNCNSELMSRRFSQRSRLRLEKSKSTVDLKVSRQKSRTASAESDISVFYPDDEDDKVKELPCFSSAL